MEPTRLANRNHLVKSNLDAVAQSWEEEAFTEDATGPFGAFIWPPRSYNCVFCGREFRSAQALGGHMNIHRRDKAKLKRPLSPPNDLLDHDCKRHRRISEVSLPAFPITSSYVDNSHLKKKVVRVCPGAADELDLELRLGLKPNLW